MDMLDAISAAAKPVRINEVARLALPAIITACRNDTREDGETIEEMFARKAYDVSEAMEAERAKRDV